jgi:hypothetical protein
MAQTASDSSSTPNVEDLVGKTFGEWTVLRVSLKKKKPNGGMYYFCKCSCGTEKEVGAESLRNGKSTACVSCGRKKTIKRFCKNGHDTELCGRTNSYACRECLRDKHLRDLYGINSEEFMALYAFQKGLCAVCKKPLGLYRTGKPGWDNGCRIEVDHKHGTKLPKRNTVRGLLCGGRWAGCNRKLGRIDNSEWLKNALEYISNPPALSVISPTIVDNRKAKRGKTSNLSKKGKS